MAFYVCCNLAAFVLHASGLYPTGSELYANATDITSTFSLSIFVGLGIGGGLLGIIALLTKQASYASFALLIWAVGIFLPIAQWFIAGVPIALALMLPSELWFIASVIEAMCIMLFFIFFLGIVTQRHID